MGFHVYCIFIQEKGEIDLKIFEPEWCNPYCST